MPRKRNKENQGLPSRWKFAHGAYYYQVPAGMESSWDGKKLFRLGKQLHEAYQCWTDRLKDVDGGEKIRTIADLLDRYLLEVVPTKAPASRPLNELWIRKLRAVFGVMSLSQMKPTLIYQYVDKRSKKYMNENGKIVGGKIAAHREVEVLSHAFTKAVKWGLIDRHPFFKEVELKGERPRDRYVNDWEVEECLSLKSRQKKGSVHTIHAYIRLKLQTGMARSDLLRLTESNFTHQGIQIQRHKTKESTGKTTIYAWTDELRSTVEQAKDVRPVSSKFLFCNRKGEGYFNEKTGECHGWDSMWQRFMDRVVKETKVTDKFHDHDLRAKVASDADTLEEARALLSHADPRTTERIYRRKPEIVQPRSAPNKPVE